jgi:hypothetical protein
VRDARSAAGVLDALQRRHAALQRGHAQLVGELVPAGGNDRYCLGYEYDFGDGWRHRIAVEKRLPVDPERNTRPMCIAGANDCPPEDVGGPPGYLDFLEAMHDPVHAEHLDRWRWNAHPFDPTAFSLNDANRAIGRVR